ncbi:MAG: hypothetical protein EBU84_12420 [Actinobacteria bacterium]|nr:hypothetical protein [Actinomycetota bacterium]
MITRFLLAFSFVLSLIACGGSGHEGHAGHTAPKTSLDSLYSSIWDAHDAVMPKMGKIRGAQRKAGHLLDSINLAWSKRSMAEPEQVKAWKAALQSVIDELNYADYSMDRWMTEFNIDSAQKEGETRRPYLESEKIKVDKVKEAVLRSLSRADSLFATIH